MAAAAAVAIEEGTQVLDLYQAAICHFTTTLRYAMYVDNTRIEPPPEQRIAFVAASPIDPMIAAMIDRHGPVDNDVVDFEVDSAAARATGYAGPDCYTIASPLIEPNGVLGYVRMGALVPTSRALRRDAAVLATYLSVHLARLGAAAVPEWSVLHALTPRQLQIARLAQRGLTNGEIGDALEISPNTVKKLLAQVFTRLEVYNRTELAALMVRVSPEDDLRPGVHRVQSSWVTKADLGPKRSAQERRPGNS